MENQRMSQTAPPAIIVDVRPLIPRDRHKTFFDRLAALATGETLRLINDHDPVPLRYQLDAEFPSQYLWTVVESGPDRWVADLTSRVRTIDARPILAAGGEPFDAISAAAAETADNEVLVVLAPFEPVRLVGVLGEQGFTHVAEQIDPGTWRIRFSRR